MLDALPAKGKVSVAVYQTEIVRTQKVAGTGAVEFAIHYSFLGALSSKLPLSSKPGVIDVAAQRTGKHLLCGRCVHRRELLSNNWTAEFRDTAG